MFCQRRAVWGQAQAHGEGVRCLKTICQVGRSAPGRVVQLTQRALEVGHRPVPIDTVLRRVQGDVQRTRGW